MCSMRSGNWWSIWPWGMLLVWNSIWCSRSLLSWKCWTYRKGWIVTGCSLMPRLCSVLCKYGICRRPWLIIKANTCCRVIFCWWPGEIYQVLISEREFAEIRLELWLCRTTGKVIDLVFITMFFLYGSSWRWGLKRFCEWRMGVWRPSKGRIYDWSHVWMLSLLLLLLMSSIVV